MTDAESVIETGGRSAEDLKEALFEVATALNMGVDRQRVLKQIAVQLARLVPHTEVLVSRADPVARVVRPVFAQGEHASRKLAMRIPYGEGVTGRVAETGEAVIYNQSDSDDPDVEPAPVPGGGPADDEYLMAVPLHSPDGIVGVLTLYRQGPEQQRWRAEDLRMLKLFAAHAQVAFHNAELYEAAEERAKRLAAMNHVLRSTSASLDADVQTICASWERALRDLIPFTITGIALERPAGRCLAVWLSDGINFTVGQALPPESGPVWVIRNGRGYVLEDIRVHSPYGPHAGLEEGQVAAVVTAPLKARGGTYGVIGLGHPEPGKYDDRTLRLLEEVGVYLGAAIDNALLYQEVLDRRKNQSRLLARLISAQEEERKGLAAELHDDTIQAMAAALLQLDRIAMRDPARQAEVIDKLRNTLEPAIGRARRLMVDLRPPVLDNGGLVPALQQQLKILAQEDEVTVELVTRIEGRLEATAETVLFRSMQEALHNVRKHAHASRVVLELRTGPEGWAIGSVSDDGVGFDVVGVLRRAVSDGHLGLHSMLERVETAGGRVDIDARPGGGTRLTVSVPSTIGVPE
jgi:signal transduction histidine kinase